MPKQKSNQIWNIIVAEYKNHEVDSINYYRITSVTQIHFKMSDVDCNKFLYSTGNTGLHY